MRHLLLHKSPRQPVETNSAGSSLRRPSEAYRRSEAPPRPRRRSNASPTRKEADHVPRARAPSATQIYPRSHPDEALEKKDLETLLSQSLQQPADIYRRDGSGNAALHLAARRRLRASLRLSSTSARIPTCRTVRARPRCTSPPAARSGFLWVRTSRGSMQLGQGRAARIRELLYRWGRGRELAAGRGGRRGDRGG